MRGIKAFIHSLKKTPIETKIGLGVLLIHFFVISVIRTGVIFTNDQLHSSRKLIKLHLKDYKKVRNQIIETEVAEIKKPKENAYQSNIDNFVEKESVAKTQRARRGRKLAKQAQKMGFAHSNPYKISKEKMEEVQGELKGMGVAESSNSDYVTDVPLGDITYLNSAKNRYYGFYHRIKTNVEQHWSRMLQKKVDQIYDRGGRVPASVDRMTNLVVTLDSRGVIIGVKVVTTSGVSEFDDVAIESFNKAGPFPNPPKGLIKNGVAKIEWGFVVRT